MSVGAWVELGGNWVGTTVGGVRLGWVDVG